MESKMGIYRSMKHLLTYQLFEGTQEVKTIKPIKPQALTLQKTTPLSVKNNKEIIKVLADKNIKLGLNPTSPDFLSQVTKHFLDTGLEPRLEVLKGQKGLKKFSPGLTFTVPKSEISFDIDPGYFGVDLPFLKGTTLGLAYTAAPSTGGGVTNPMAAGDARGNSKYSVALTIPLTK